MGTMPAKRALFLVILVLCATGLVVFAGHDKPAQCPTGNVHCLARRQQFYYGDSAADTIVATLNDVALPCVYGECDNAGDFGCGTMSNMALWAVAERQGTGGAGGVPVPEIGVVRFSTATGGTIPRIYT